MKKQSLRCAIELTTMEVLGFYSITFRRSASKFSIFDRIFFVKTIYKCDLVDAVGVSAILFVSEFGAVVFVLPKVYLAAQLILAAGKNHHITNGKTFFFVDNRSDKLFRDPETDRVSRDIIPSPPVPIEPKMIFGFNSYFLETLPLGQNVG